MPDAAARLIPLGGNLDSVCIFSSVMAADKKPWVLEVQGELLAADSVIEEIDGVFTISADVPTGHVVCDPGFKALVDSIMGS